MYLKTGRRASLPGAFWVLAWEESEPHCPGAFWVLTWEDSGVNLTPRVHPESYPRRIILLATALAEAA